jgi:hypothetical protein
MFGNRVGRCHSGERGITYQCNVERAYQEFEGVFILGCGFVRDERRCNEWDIVSTILRPHLGGGQIHECRSSNSSSWMFDVDLIS